MDLERMAKAFALIRCKFKCSTSVKMSWCEGVGVKVSWCEGAGVKVCWCEGMLV